MSPAHKERSKGTDRGSTVKSSTHVLKEQMGHVITCNCEIKPVPGDKQLKSSQALSRNLTLFQDKSHISVCSLHCVCLLFQICPSDILLMTAIHRKCVEVMMSSDQCSDQDHPRNKAPPLMMGTIPHQKLLVSFPCLKPYGWNCTMYVLSYFFKKKTLPLVH